MTLRRNSRVPCSCTNHNGLQRVCLNFTKFADGSLMLVPVALKQSIKKMRVLCSIRNSSNRLRYTRGICRKTLANSVWLYGTVVVWYNVIGCNRLLVRQLAASDDHVFTTECATCIQLLVVTITFFLAEISVCNHFYSNKFCIISCIPLQSFLIVTCSSCLWVLKHCCYFFRVNTMNFSLTGMCQKVRAGSLRRAALWRLTQFLNISEV
jgi:hypothetical protein